MVGKNVRRLRIASGLSQAELAARMGVDRRDLTPEHAMMLVMRGLREALVGLVSAKERA